MSLGFFIAVEGPEGAGKSTLVGGLASRLAQAGVEPLLVREPGGTPVAEAIRRLLLDPSASLEPASELYLFLAARADLVARVLGPALAEGRVVIADRFELSTIAYQVGGRGLPLDLVTAANAAATLGVRPDLTLVLDVSPRIGLDRIRAGGAALDRIEREGPGFHDRVAETFRQAGGPGVVHLAAEQSPEQVLRHAWGEVNARLAAAGARQG
jgi:dTMP kinase